MANTSSAKKQARESIKRAERNRSVRSAVKTHVVRARRAATEGTTDGLDGLAIAAIKSLDRAAAKGILHPNNAARRKSRLMKRLATAQAAPAPGQGSAKASGRKAAAGTSAKTSAPAAKPASKPAARGTRARKSS